MTTPNMSPATRRLLDHVRASGPTNESNRQLCLELGLNAATIKRCLRVLEADGLVSVDRRVADPDRGDLTGRTLIATWVQS